MGPIWGRQDPSGPHVGPMNLVSGKLLIMYTNHCEFYKLFHRFRLFKESKEVCTVCITAIYWIFNNPCVTFNSNLVETISSSSVQGIVILLTEQFTLHIACGVVTITWWRQFPHNWSFVVGTVDSPHKCPVKWNFGVVMTAEQINIMRAWTS